MKEHLLVGALCLGSSLYAGTAHAEDHDYDHAQPGLLIQNQVVVHESTDGTYFSLLGNDFGYGGVQQGGDGINDILETIELPAHFGSGGLGVIGREEWVEHGKGGG